jgi:hypothetical protein
MKTLARVRGLDSRPLLSCRNAYVKTTAYGCPVERSLTSFLILCRQTGAPNSFLLGRISLVTVLF